MILNSVDKEAKFLFSKCRNTPCKLLSSQSNC